MELLCPKRQVPIQKLDVEPVQERVGVEELVRRAGKATASNPLRSKPARIRAAADRYCTVVELRSDRGLLARKTPRGAEVTLDPGHAALAAVRSNQAPQRQDDAAVRVNRDVNDEHERSI